MVRHTRRDFLARSALLAAGMSAFPLLRPASSLAQSSASAEDLAAEDLVDTGETFRRGNARGVGFSSASNGTVLQATHDGGHFTSRVLHSSIEFTHVGLHWSAAVPSGAKLSFELRTSPDGST